MYEVIINKDNCSQLYIDEHNLISYTRVINGKIYNIGHKADDLVQTLHHLSSMDDETFKLVCKLHRSSLESCFEDS